MSNRLPFIPFQEYGAFLSAMDTVTKYENVDQIAEVLRWLHGAV